MEGCLLLETGCKSHFLIDPMCMSLNFGILLTFMAFKKGVFLYYLCNPVADLSNFVYDLSSSVISVFVIGKEKVPYRRIG